MVFLICGILKKKKKHEMERVEKWLPGAGGVGETGKD